MKLKPPFVFVDDSYKELVEGCVKVGLQKLLPSSRIWTHNGKRLVNGALAVPKSKHEDRFISALVPTNQLLDPERLPRPG